jgi:xylulokinase
MTHALGLDIGSSSVKACILDVASGAAVASATSPKKELPINAPQPGWAEQDPASWWKHAVKASRQCLVQSGLDGASISSIGISYQMHGLVCVDKRGTVLRPAIIWCDSRAVQIGEAAREAIGHEVCQQRLLNSPGNFTASKLKWVKDNQPEIYARIHKFMLPGDWIAYKLTGAMTTTASGLSESILWDFQDNAPARLLLDHYGIDAALLADVVPTFATQGTVHAKAAAELGIQPGVPVTYRAGDQPNNALSLNVLNPGELAATAGTSGVVYGISDRATADPQSRVNTFLHVNHSVGDPRYGVLLCVNGTGCCYRWLQHETTSFGKKKLDYPAMNAAAASVPVGSAGLCMLTFGNGAERTLQNRDIGASLHNLNFNVHTRAHLMRAAQEGIVFALKYGIDAMSSAGVQVNDVCAGDANLFLSPLFREAFATVTGATVELYDTDGAQGAARGAAFGAGQYANLREAFAGLKSKATIEPNASEQAAYQAAYQRWLEILESQIRS